MLLIILFKTSNMAIEHTREERQMLTKLELELADEVRKAEAMKRKVLALLDNEAINTVNHIIHLRDNSDKEQVQLEACKALAKYAGLDVQRVAHEGGVSLSIEQVDACVDAYNDDNDESL